MVCSDAVSISAVSESNLPQTGLYRHPDYKQQTRVNRIAHAMAIWHQSRVAPDDIGVSCYLSLDSPTAQRPNSRSKKFAI
jgi:hypothetical protein